MVPERRTQGDGPSIALACKAGQRYTCSTGKTLILQGEILIQAIGIPGKALFIRYIGTLCTAHCREVSTVYDMLR